MFVFDLVRVTGPTECYTGKIVGSVRWIYETGFERVFSWYVGNLRSTNYAGNSIVTNLTAWNGDTLVWPDPLKAPRVVQQTIEVGSRISAPIGELGNLAEDPYPAGYI